MSHRRTRWRLVETNSLQFWGIVMALPKKRPVQETVVGPSMKNPEATLRLVSVAKSSLETVDSNDAIPGTGEK
jgi:hypothetical protein